MYDDPELLSDDGGWLTDLGRSQAAELGERLRDERVAAVYTSRLNRAQQTGAVVGERLGLRASTVHGLQEFSVGALAGTPAMGSAAREVFVAGVNGDPDRHRGETVLVVSHGGVMTLAIPNTATNTTPELARAADIPNCGMAELAVDSDGWRLVGPWPGKTFALPDADVGSPGAGD